MAADIDQDAFCFSDNIECISVSNLTAKVAGFWLQLPFIVSEMVSELNRIKADRIIANHFPTNAVLAKSEIRGIWMCHEPYPFFHNKDIYRQDTDIYIKAQFVSALYSKYDLKYARKIDKIAANSKYTRQEIRKVFGRESVVVYPGFNRNLLNRSYPRRVLGRVLSVGPSSLIKHFEYTLKAFVNLYQEGIACSLRVVGFVHLIYAKMIEDTKRVFPEIPITCLGFTPKSNIYEEYASAAVLSFPSINEPFGIVPIEAAATGTPVCYFLRGEPLESMRNGKTCIGATSTTQEEYTNAMDSILERKMVVNVDDPMIKNHLNKFTLGHHDQTPSRDSRNCSYELKEEG